MGEIKRLFYCFLFFLWAFIPNLGKAQEAGATNWYNLPFGQVRLLSCLDGVQQNKIVVGGLQVKINPEWRLKKPTLKSLDEKTPLWIEYPIRPAVQKTTTYQDKVFFPMVGSPLLADKDFNFGLQGDLTACHEKGECLTLPIQVQLPLKKGTGEYTSYCAYIMNQMNQVPLPFVGKVQAQILSPYRAQFLFFDLKNIRQAFLQNDQGIDFKILKRQFLDQGVLLDVLFSKQIQPEENQNWILITNQGVFRVPVVLKTTPVASFSPSIPWISLIFSGFLVFFFSPFYICWGLAWGKTKKEETLRLTQMAQKSTYLILLLAGLGFVFSKMGLGIFDSSLLVCLSLSFLIFCLIVPPVKSWFFVLAFFLFPKPYLISLFDFLNANPTWFIVWIILTLMCIWGLFYGRFRGFNGIGKLIRRCLKEHFFLTNLFFLLPTLFLLGGQIKALQTPVPVFENHLHAGVNVICSGAQCDSWMGSNSFSKTFISGNSLMGKALLEKYPHQIPLVILIDKNEMTIFDSKITPKKLGLFLKDWQNYHVLGTPKNPPIRFEGGPHAPLPNAR